MNIIEIPTHLIDEDENQPRYQFDEAALQELMDSIRELGLLSPIKVRAISGGRYKIIYGNRRYKACSMLNRPAIPCIVSMATDEVDIYLEQVAENLTREGFSPIEEAEAFDKMLHDPRFGSSVKFLASRFGKLESYIKNKCELLKFGPAVRKLIAAGSEIRKGRLTEEQLLPLKDLALEHRDPLALIVARDELPVSDVKKIAQLFKADDMSTGTKDKLLYKDGRQLLETWYVYKQNKAEREKPVAPRPAKAGKTVSSDTSAASAGAGDTGAQAAGHPIAGIGAAAATTGDSREPGAANAATAGDSHAAAATAGGTANNPVPAAASVHAARGVSTAAATTIGAENGSAPVAGPAAAESAIEGRLQQLLAAIPAYSPLAPEAVGSCCAKLAAAEKEGFLHSVDSLLANLEQHIMEWRKIREQAAQS